MFSLYLILVSLFLPTRLYDIAAFHGAFPVLHVTGIALNQWHCVSMWTRPEKQSRHPFIILRQVKTLINVLYVNFLSFI